MHTLCRCFVMLACGLATTARAQTQSDSARLELPPLQLSHRTTLKAFPYAYYTPETELAIGAGGILTFYTGQDSVLLPSKVGASAYYSTRKQYKVSLDPEVYLHRNEMFMSLYADLGEAVNKFYGIGNETPDMGLEDYQMFYWGVKAEFQRKTELLKVTRAGLLYEYHREQVTDKKANPALLSDTVTGSTGGAISGLGYTALVDSRDHIFFPNTGGRYAVEIMVYPDWLGSDFNYNVTTVDLRQFRQLSPDHVLAFQVYGQFAGGNVPFYRLPALGGQNRMRGYFYGRYVDNYYVTGQAEYRQYFWNRLGFVVFGGLGDVGHGARDFALKDFKISAGAGLRLKFNEEEKVNLRVDLGIGRDINGVYFGLEEAF
jgi:outer membrane protein assembly factor BamA